jgi:uncharacterized membrane protein YqhA
MELGVYSFVPFAVSLFVLFAILTFYLPETKGRQISDVVDLFQVPNAWSVISWGSYENFMRKFDKIRPLLRKL